MTTDGETAIAYAETKTFDLIILDIMLPKLDGILVCRQLQHKGLQVSILMLTARDTSEDKIRGLDQGADDYLVKPFDIPELSVRSHLSCLAYTRDPI